MTKETKIAKGIKLIEVAMKKIADKYIHKPHDHIECLIQNNKETGKSFREFIPEDLEDEIIGEMNSQKFVYVKRNKESNIVFCYVYDIHLVSLYFKIKVKLSRNEKLTLALSKCVDLHSLVSDCGYRGKYLTSDFNKIMNQ